jgi:hypothetical protein
MPVKGGYLALTGVGGLLLWSGLKGKSWSTVLRSTLQGKGPQTATTAYSISGTPAGNTGGVSGSGSYASSSLLTSASTAALKVYAQTLLVKHGWAGQFGAFNNIVMAESGWNPQAYNPSGAWGVAQALGHGTPATDAGNGHNEYGNYGTSDAVCKAANGGNGSAQIQWMMNYIASRYGSPNAAWAYHLANNSY